MGKMSAPYINEVVTACGDIFTAEEARTLARLLYKRFGYDRDAASAAWVRLFAVPVTGQDFLTQLVAPGA